MSEMERLEALEKRIAELEEQVRVLASPQLDEDTVLAISAAVAAYLGVKAKVRAIHYTSSSRWASAGRQAVHRHDVH